MLTINGLADYLLPRLANTPAANYSLPLYIISNSSYELVKQKPGDSDLKPPSQDANEAHDMAYSAYKPRAERAIAQRQYSESAKHH